MVRLKIGLDWDDTFAPFNSVACKKATEKYNIAPELSINDIESWANTGRASVIKEFYMDPELYKEQSLAVREEDKNAVKRLLTKEFGFSRLKTTGWERSKAAV